MASRRWLVLTLALLVLTAGVFAIWPDLDLAVARAFYRDGGFIGRGGLWSVGREFFRFTPFVVQAAFILLYIGRRFGLSLPYAPSGRQLAFLVATALIGPLLVVNIGLKDHAHRPRPAQTQDFGGTNEFRPWYRFDGGCKKNCSFVSGEAAQGFWMIAPASLAPPPLQPFAITAALIFGAAASLFRVAAGGHYLSDVILAGLITILIVQVAARLLFSAKQDDS